MRRDSGSACGFHLEVEEQVTGHSFTGEKGAYKLCNFKLLA